MDQYYHKESTPLKFHNFLRYFSLPIGFLINATSLIYVGIIIFEDLDTQFFVLLYYITALALMLACFIGFLNWKPYAWYCVIIYPYLGVFYNLFNVVSCALYIPNQIGTALGQLLGTLYYAIMVNIYYMKRRPLFFLNTIQAIAEEDYNLTSDELSNTDSLDSPPLIRFCRKCGYELLCESDFCSECGTPVVKE